MTQQTTIDRLFLKSLLLAEITRHKFGKDGISLTSPTIERNARKSFALVVGINPSSKPSVFINAIGKIYEDNGLFTSFIETLNRFKLNHLDF